MKNKYYLSLILIPVVYLLHNLEKVWYINYWLEKHPVVYPVRISAYFSGNIDPKIFFSDLKLGFVIAALVPAFLSLYCVFSTRRKLVLYMLAAVGLSLGINTVQHVATALLFWQLNPGLITSFIINLPFSFFLIGAIKKEFEIKHIPVGVYYLLPFILIPPVLCFAFQHSYSVLFLF
jgi:hypothetical protein